MDDSEGHAAQPPAVVGTAPAVIFRPYGSLPTRYEAPALQVSRRPLH